MSAYQRFLSWALVPILVLLGLQLWHPELLHLTLSSLQLQAGNLTVLGQFLAGTLPPRSEIPLVIASFPHWSHYEKISKVSVALAELGYPVTLVTGQIFEDSVKSLHPNIKFWPIQGKPDKMTEEEYEQLKTMSPGSTEARIFMLRKGLLGGIPDQHETLQQVFRDQKIRYGDSKPLISFFDATFIGHHPILLGAPGVRPDASLTISCHPILLDSNDTYPCHTPRAPATGSDARKLHQEANQPKHMDHVTREMTRDYWQSMQDSGATEVHDWHVYHGMAAVGDYLMSMGVPQFDFPRSGDPRPNFHFFGATNAGKKQQASQAELPEWWSDVAAAKQGGKKIVAVSQGTVAPDLSELLIPTLNALKDRTDVLVIATTVATEVRDVPDLAVPTNARIAKFVPYDMLLSQVDVLVNNGGYGAVINSLQHGIPMVVAGLGQDKNLTNTIVQWKEVGVNLGTQRPSVDEVREAITKVLADGKYKRNAVAMSKHFGEYNIAKIFDGVIQNVLRKWQKEKRKENDEERCTGEV